MFEGMTMETVFVVTYGGVILGTIAVTLFGCWVAERLKRRRGDRSQN